MPLASWLFLKGTESIWIERPHGRAIIVAGPGPAKEEHNFSTDEALQAFQVTLTETLAGAGWFLWGFDRERRGGPDRRAAGRGGADRREARVIDIART
jgi:hypothetical protein